MNLRNVDLEKTLPVSEVLAVLDELTEALASKEPLESGDYDADEREFLPATPQQVLTHCQERLDEARLSILGMIP
jgi:hypothetical protein